MMGKILFSLVAFCSNQTKVFKISTLEKAMMVSCLEVGAQPNECLH